MNQISGAILAGGRSSRFGRDKALEVWQDKTLLEHVEAALEGCQERFIVGGNPERYGFLNLPVHSDLEIYPGSLYGLARALELASFPRVAISACDTPNLTRNYWEFIANFSDFEIVIPENAGGFLEPLAAIYSKNCFEYIGAALEAGNLKMTGWFEQFIGERVHGCAPLRVRVVKWSELEPHFEANLFLNANTPSDLLG
jgi:molybdenum cofactor guanylyltransferase